RSTLLIDASGRVEKTIKDLTPLEFSPGNQYLIVSQNLEISSLKFPNLEQVTVRPNAATQHEAVALGINAKWFALYPPWDPRHLLPTQTLRFWDLDRREIRRVEAPGLGDDGCAISSDGRLIAFHRKPATDRRGEMGIWDTITQTDRSTFLKRVTPDRI